MGLLYYPSPGEIVACHFDVVTIEPEMTKTRPVVVIGPRLRRRGRLVTVVPLSTTDPDEVQNYHCQITLAQPLPRPFDAPVMWAKCDMICTVSLDRLDRFKEPQGRYGGPRRWRTGRATQQQIAQIRAAVLCGLGLGN